MQPSGHRPRLNTVKTETNSRYLSCVLGQKIVFVRFLFDVILLVGIKWRCVAPGTCPAAYLHQLHQGWSGKLHDLHFALLLHTQPHEG